MTGSELWREMDRMWLASVNKTKDKDKGIHTQQFFNVQSSLFG